MSTINPQFDAIDLIKRSWDPVMKNGGPLIGGVVVVILINAAASAIPFSGLFIQGPLQYGLYAMALAAARGRAVEFGELFSGFQRFIPVFVAGLLISVFTVIGLLGCFVGAFFVGILYAPTYLYMIDEGLDFWPAMEKSRITVMNNFGQWCLLGVVLFGLNVLGALACCLGTLVTAPMSMVVICMAYDMQRAADRPLPPPVVPAGAV